MLGRLCDLLALFAAQRRLRVSVVVLLAVALAARIFVELPRPIDLADDLDPGHPVAVSRESNRALPIVVLRFEPVGPDRAMALVDTLRARARLSAGVVGLNAGPEPFASSAPAEAPRARAVDAARDLLEQLPSVEPLTNLGSDATLVDLLNVAERLPVGGPGLTLALAELVSQGKAAGTDHLDTALSALVPPHPSSPTSSRRGLRLRDGGLEVFVRLSETVRPLQYESVVAPLVLAGRELGLKTRVDGVPLRLRPFNSPGFWALLFLVPTLLAAFVAFALGVGLRVSLMIVLSVTGAMALPLLGLWLTGKGIDPGAIWALSVTGALFAATALGLAAIRAGYTGGTTGHEPPLKVLRSALRGTALPVGCAAFVLAVAAVSTGYAAPSAAVVFAGASAGLVVLWGVFLPGLLMLKPSPPASSVAPLKPRVWASTTRHFSGVAVAVAGVALLIMSRREAPAAIAPELAAGLPIVSLFETESEARVFASAVASVAGVSEVIASAAGVTAALAARDRVLSTEAWALLSRRAAVERDRLRGQPAPVFKPSTVEDLKVWASRHETSDSAHARSAATLIQALTSGETATTERALSFAASAAGYALKGLRASWQRTLTDASAEGDAAAAGDAAADRAFFDVSSGRAFAAVVVGPNVSDPRIVNPLDGDATARRPPAVGLLFWAGVAASLLVLCLASAVSAWPRVLALPAVALLGATPVFHAQTLLDAPPPSITSIASMGAGAVGVIFCAFLMRARAAGRVMRGLLPGIAVTLLSGLIAGAAVLQESALSPAAFLAVMGALAAMVVSAAAG